MPITTTYADKVTLLKLGEDENRFSLDFLDEIGAHLDEIADSGAAGLVTTGTGKFYSNGLDLDWLLAHGEQMQFYVGRVHALFARILTLPLPTAAALNGHAFGAGAMLAMAHDYRVMREDRGHFCFPEVDIRIPFTTGMAALIQAKLTPAAAVASMTTGRRFGGADAWKLAIVDATAAQDNVTDAAVGFIAPLGGKDPGHRCSAGSPTCTSTATWRPAWRTQVRCHPGSPNCCRQRRSSGGRGWTSRQPWMQAGPGRRDVTQLAG